MKTSASKVHGVRDAFYGTVTVGERGQIVIPAEARADMHLVAGEKLLVMRHPAHAGLMLSRIDDVREFLDDFQSTLNQISGDQNDGDPNTGDQLAGEKGGEV